MSQVASHTNDHDSKQISVTLCFSVREISQKSRFSLEKGRNYFFWRIATLEECILTLAIRKNILIHFLAVLQLITRLRELTKAELSGFT